MILGNTPKPAKGRLIKQHIVKINSLTQWVFNLRYLAMLFNYSYNNSKCIKLEQQNRKKWRELVTSFDRFTFYISHYVNQFFEKSFLIKLLLIIEKIIKGLLS